MIEINPTLSPAMRENITTSYEVGRRASRQERLAKLPRVRWIWCQRDWWGGGGTRMIGVEWDKDPDPDEGAIVYRRRIILRFAFRIGIEWKI